MRIFLDQNYCLGEHNPTTAVLFPSWDFSFPNYVLLARGGFFDERIYKEAGPHFLSTSDAQAAAYLEQEFMSNQ